MSEKPNEKITKKNSNSKHRLIVVPHNCLGTKVTRGSKEIRKNRSSSKSISDSVITPIDKKKIGVTNIRQSKSYKISEDSDSEGEEDGHYGIYGSRSKLEVRIPHNVRISKNKINCYDKPICSHESWKTKISMIRKRDLSPSDYDIQFASYISKVKRILTVLERGILSVDVKISLYISACTDIARCLHPYPERYFQNSQRGYYKLKELNEKIPSTRSLNEFLDMQKNPKPHTNLVNLLHWILVEFKEPRLVPQNRKQILHTGKRLSNIKWDKKPSIVFKLMCSRISPIESRWDILKHGYETKYAFYSTGIENLFTLTNFGFTAQLYESGICGKGIYLTNHLGTALTKCWGNGWEKSYIGEGICIVSIVELVAHPGVICYAGVERCPISPERITLDEEPLTLFIQKADYIRLRYIMVFTSVKPPELYERHGMPLWRRISKKKAASVCLTVLFLSFSYKWVSNSNFGRNIIKNLKNIAH